MSEYGIYPNSSPEFRMVQKDDGTMAMQVRYICAPQGYTGKWMDVKTEKANDKSNSTDTQRHV
jgi:hypothetical protein